MEVSWGKKSVWIYFDISPLFFHIVSKTFFVTYDKIFQALAVEGDVLLPTPFLDLGFDGVARWTRKSPVSEMFFRFVKHVKVREGRVGAVQWAGWGPEMASKAERLLLQPGLGKFHRILWQVPEQVWGLCGKYRTNIETYPCAFLV
jgi:hypothetical protein